MSREEIVEFNEEALMLPEKYDSAIIGVAERINLTVVAYDSAKLVELIAEEMSPDIEDVSMYGDIETAKYNMALEYYDYNIKGAWLGENTPVFITTTEFE